MKLRADTRRAVFEAGWHVLSVYQVPQPDARKLTRCPLPTDPWTATIYNSASILTATRQASAQGVTADEAVLNALGGASMRLEAEIDRLIAVLRGS